MTTTHDNEIVPTAGDPTFAFIRRELAASPERWVASLTFAGLAMLGVLATVTFQIPYPVLVFAGIVLLSVPHPKHPIRQAVAVSFAVSIGAGSAILLAVTTYDQPWLYLPLQCGALTTLLVLSQISNIHAGFILAAMVLSFAEPAYLANPDTASTAALLNALAVAGTAWVVAAIQCVWVTAKAETPPISRRRLGQLGAFAVLASTAIGLQMLFYNTINLPELRTGVVAALLTADVDPRQVFERMPLRQLCAIVCAVFALLLVAVGAPVMDDLGSFSLLAAVAYFATGWIGHGGPRIAFACAPGAVTITLVLLQDVRFTTDIVTSLLEVVGVLWGTLVTAIAALLLSPLAVQPARPELHQWPDVPAA